MEIQKKTQTILIIVLGALLTVSVALNIVLVVKNADSTSTQTPDMQQEIDSDLDHTADTTEAGEPKESEDNTEKETPEEEDDTTPVEDEKKEEETTKPTVYQNSYVSITLEDGWKAQGLANGSVNITKGDYILYINPAYKQTSGVTGARFAEISNGAPSADLVTVYQPAMECTPAKQSSTQNFERYDVYTNDSVDTNLCKATTDNSTRWYFTYYVEESPYVTYLSTDNEKSLVITLAIDTSTLSGLPRQNDSTLQAILNAADAMVDSLILK